MLRIIIAVWILTSIVLFLLGNFINCHDFFNCFIFVTGSHLLNDMSGEMVFKQKVLDARNSLLNGYGLGKNINAVLFLLYHFLQAADLPRGNFKPTESFLFDFALHMRLVYPHGVLMVNTWQFLCSFHFYEVL